MNRSGSGCRLSGLIITLPVILALLLTDTLAEAQVLKGKITDKSGQPVKYATIFIQELKQGTSSNTKGDYEIRLAAGNYKVFYQSLGYEPVITDLTIKSETIIHNIVLSEQYYKIPEVRVIATGEDPACLIMRKTIGLAPFYLNQINHYKANVYLKGSLLIKRIPRIVQKYIKAEAKNESSGSSISSTTIREGQSYLLESYNEIDFSAPDKYVNRVISLKSTFPQEGNEISPMDYIQASFYQPVIANMAISPLSPSAFSHYKFRYLGASSLGNFTINKIEVIPKRKSQQLFSGTIYIIDGLWCLESVDLVNKNLGGTIRIKQLYIPVQDDIWMPVSHNFQIDIDIMGFKADVAYGSSVKYMDVSPNKALKKPDPLKNIYTGKYPYADTLMTKSRQQIEKILQKDDLNNRDMVRLSNLMKKESEKTISDSIRKNPEIKNKTTYIVEKDAAKKDSVYWAKIRPIPLSESELHGIRLYDSTKATTLSTSFTGTDSLKHAKRKYSETILKKIVSGNTWSDTTGFSLTHSGLLNLRNLSFNTVDGFVYGMDFSISKKLKDLRTISLYPEVNYAFNREKIMWKASANFSKGGMNPRQLFIRTGITSKDISTGGSINTFLNSITSLMMRKNYLKLYETRYLTVGYGFEITNGLNIELSTGFEDRRVLENNTDFSLIKSSREYTDNIPDNDYLAGGSNPYNMLAGQKHYDFVTNVTFVPFQKYRIYNGNKIPDQSDRPVFRLSWKHGVNKVPVLAKGYKHFDMIRFEISERLDIGAFNEIRWKFRTGGFIDNRNISYFDFFHFNSQPFPLMIDDYDDAFMLPAFYSLSTPEFFGEAHFKYTTPYLFLKLLPGLSNTLIRENLTFSYLGSRFHSGYTELGYSLSQIFLIGEAGVYIGLDNLKYRNAGIKLIFRFN